MGHLEQVLLKLEWAYKVLKFGEAKEPEKAEIAESKLDLELNLSKSSVTFKFIDANNETVTINNANIANLDPANIRLLCYFKAREEVKPVPVDKENLEETKEEAKEPVEKPPKTVQIIDVQSS